MPSSSSTRNAPVAVTALLAILGLALIVIAAFYFTHIADQAALVAPRAPNRRQPPPPNTASPHSCSVSPHGSPPG